MQRFFAPLRHFVGFVCQKRVRIVRNMCACCAQGTNLPPESG
jgi:hypothetical protein